MWKNWSGRGFHRFGRSHFANFSKQACNGSEASLCSTTNRSPFFSSGTPATTNVCSVVPANSCSFSSILMCGTHLPTGGPLASPRGCRLLPAQGLRGHFGPRRRERVTVKESHAVELCRTGTVLRGPRRPRPPPGDCLRHYQRHGVRGIRGGAGDARL